MKRYDLVTNYRCGSAIEEMERNDEDGEWVRYEDVSPAAGRVTNAGQQATSPAPENLITEEQEP